MNHRLILADGRAAACQSLGRKAKTKKHDPQMPVCRHERVVAMGDRIVKLKYLFQVCAGFGKSAGVQQVPAGRSVPENESGGVVALTADAQNIFIAAPRHIDIAASAVIDRELLRNHQELRGRAQLLPELARASIGTARFWRS